MPDRLEILTICAPLRRKLPLKRISAGNIQVKRWSNLRR